MRKAWGGRNLIGISILLVLASCAVTPPAPMTSLSTAETSAQAQDAAPVISSISFGTSPARGDTYELGETVVVFVQFDGPVETTDPGEFQMALTIGAETQYATLVGWRSDHRYRFEYTVQEPDRDEDGISIPANAIVLNGGTITDPRRHDRRRSHARDGSRRRRTQDERQPDIAAGGDKHRIRF